MSDIKDPRVLFAAERTLLAWNRTSLALIAFGFLIERAGMLMHMFSSRQEITLSMSLTFWIGLAFIFLGSLCSLYSSWQFRILLKTLTPVEYPPRYNATWGMIVNVLVAALGFTLVVALSIDGFAER